MALLMVDGRPDLDVLRERVYAAIEDIESEDFLALLSGLGAEMPDYLRAHLEMSHSVPSPSGVTACRLAAYWRGKEREPDHKVPAYWTKRQVAGTIMEPFWHAILQRAGLPLYRTHEAIQCGPHMKGHPDGYIAETGLLELKDMNGWAYKRLLESQGVAYEEPRHYAQMQLYMDGAARDWCLYFATPADPGMLQGIMRGYEAYGTEYILPLYYAEIVERRDMDIRAGHARAEMIATAQLSDPPPP